MGGGSTTLGLARQHPPVRGPGRPTLLCPKHPLGSSGFGSSFDGAVLLMSPITVTESKSSSALPSGQSCLPRYSHASARALSGSSTYFPSRVYQIPPLEVRASRPFGYCHFPSALLALAPLG